MIFVAVGTVHGFERLVRLVDRWAEGHAETVVAQIGLTRFEPRHCTWFRFAPPRLMYEHIEDSRAVVTHAGVGMMLDVLDRRRKLLIVPRLAGLGEHIDDHQLELADELADQGLATIIHDQTEMAQALNRSDEAEPVGASTGELVAAVADVLTEWDTRSRSS